MKIKLNNSFHLDLIAEVTAEEVYKVVRSMPNNKSSGPNGFTSEFFKATWSTTGD